MPPGRPPHQPTEEQRAQVEALAGFGVTEKEIGTYIGIDVKTLRKHYRRELDTGHIRTNVEVATNLYNQTKDNPTAAIFWLKIRAQWTHKTPHEQEIARLQIAKLKAEIKSLEKGVNVNVFQTMTDAELEIRLKQLQKQLADGDGSAAAPDDKP